MNTETPTYTRSQAMTALGITSRSAFHHLRKKYPSAFVVIKQGHGRGNLTLYDKATLDKFIEWRAISRGWDQLAHNIINDPIGFILPKKGKQS